MTVDVDSWSSLLDFYEVDDFNIVSNENTNIETGISRLLSIFRKHGILATFFVPGEVAHSRPEILKLISQQGHEIACHGLLHIKNEYLASENEQDSRIEEATTLIEKATNVRPLGFRAPCLKSNEQTLRILTEKGYLYDSSLIPTFIPGYYGNPMKSNMKPHWFSFQFNGNERALLEIPVAVNPMLFIPISASWMRNLGVAWVKLGIKLNFLLRNVVVFYIHPRDVVSLERSEKVPAHVYRNSGTTALNMLDNVLTYAKKLDAVFQRAVDFARTFPEIAILE